MQNCEFLGRFVARLSASGQRCLGVVAGTYDSSTWRGGGGRRPKVKLTLSCIIGLRSVWHGSLKKKERKRRRRRKRRKMKLSVIGNDRRI